MNPCCHSPYVTSFLTREWVCRLQLLLVLASGVILRSESRGTHDHILLSQIRHSSNLEDQVPVFISPQEEGGPVIPPGVGFLFLRILPLAGLRWKGVTYRRVSDWWTDLLHLCTQLVTTRNTALSLIYTLYSSLLHTVVPSLLIICDCLLQGLPQFYLWAAWDPRFIASGLPLQKTTLPLLLLLIHCCRDAFTVPLHSNECGTDHRNNRSSIVARSFPQECFYWTVA
jgi:hypothetical protein